MGHSVARSSSLLGHLIIDVSSSRYSTVIPITSWPSAVQPHNSPIRTMSSAIHALQDLGILFFMLFFLQYFPGISPVDTIIIPNSRPKVKLCKLRTQNAAVSFYIYFSLPISYSANDYILNLFHYILQVLNQLYLSYNIKEIVIIL